MKAKDEDEIIIAGGRGTGKTYASLRKYLKSVGAFITFNEPKIQIIKPKSKFHK